MKWKFRGNERVQVEWGKTWSSFSLLSFSGSSWVLEWSSVEENDLMRKTVRKLARCFPIAIVTGRCKDKVYYFVRLAELYYAGIHGMDIKGPTRSSEYNKDSKAEAILCQRESDFLPMIYEVYQQLVEKTKSTPGALVENNKFYLSVHFHCVDEKKWSELARQVKSVLKEYPKLRLTQGRKVLEIHPTIKWDKGKALDFLLESLDEARCMDLADRYVYSECVKRMLQTDQDLKHGRLKMRVEETSVHEG